MNVLGINLDKGIFKEKSVSLERLKEYSRLVDKLFIIVWTTEKFEPIVVDDRLFIYPTDSCCRAGYYLDTLRLAKRIINRNKLDVVFTQDPFETGLAGWIVSKLHKISLQIQIHTDVFSPYFWKESLANKMRVLLAKFLIPRAKTLRVVSERIKESIISNIRYPISKIFVLPIFVDVKKIQETPVTTDLHKKYPQFDFIILMASRLTREKNIGSAIATMLEVVKKCPKVGLLIVGSGPEEKKLKLQAAHYKLQDNIRFEPWTDNIYSYYKTADLFLLTSNYEGFGLSVIEAMATGCPVAMTDVGCTGALAKNIENATVVPVGDGKKLAIAVMNLISDANLRARLGEKGKLIDVSLYSQSKYHQMYLQSWQATL